MASPLPKGYVCHRATTPITIDGKLDDPAWENAPWTDEFEDIQGGSMPAPRFRTRAKMLWDDDYLYIGAEMEEPHVWGTLTERDSVIFQDNDFEVFIDPDGDNHEYYEIEVNALNTVWDLRLVKPYRDGGPALNEWDIHGFKTGVFVNGTLNDSSDTDRGWSLEMAFPWPALSEYANRPAPPHDGDQWRINFSRVEWEIVIEEGRYRKIPGKPEDNWVWSPQGVIDMHRPERWGYVQFSTAEPGAAPFRRDPGEAPRNALHRIYYAQKARFEREKAWADSLEALDLPVSAFGGMKPAFRLTPEGYEASLDWRYPDGETHRWRIRQDSRVWEE